MSRMRKLAVTVLLLIIVSGCRDIAEANLPYGYIIEPDQVLWYDRPIEGADPETFEWLTDDGKKLPWGRDKDRLYYRNLPVPDADPETFEGFKEMPSYAKDANHVYVGDYQSIGEVLFSGKNSSWRRKMRLPATSVDVVKEADAKSFHYLSSVWFADDYHLFRHKELIDHVDPVTFRPLYQEHAGRDDWHLDANHVYRGDRLLKHADPKSFRIDPESGDVMDDKFVFHGLERYEAVVAGVVIPANSKSWRVINQHYRTDGRFVFERSGEVVKGADADTFEEVTGKYYKDRSYVYYDSILIHDVDVASFRIGEDGIPFDRDGPLGPRIPK